MTQTQKPAYEAPAVIVLGDFVKETNGSKGNDKVDDTMYWN